MLTRFQDDSNKSALWWASRRHLHGSEIYASSLTLSDHVVSFHLFAQAQEWLLLDTIKKVEKLKTNIYNVP